MACAKSNRTPSNRGNAEKVKRRKSKGWSLDIWHYRCIGSSAWRTWYFPTPALYRDHIYRVCYSAAIFLELPGSFVEPKTKSPIYGNTSRLQGDLFEYPNLKSTQSTELHSNTYAVQKNDGHYTNSCWAAHKLLFDFLLRMTRTHRSLHQLLSAGVCCPSSKVKTTRTRKSAAHTKDFLLRNTRICINLVDTQVLNALLTEIFKSSWQHAKHPRWSRFSHGNAQGFHAPKYDYYEKADKTTPFLSQSIFLATLSITLVYVEQYRQVHVGYLIRRKLNAYTQSISDLPSWIRESYLQRPRSSSVGDIVRKGTCCRAMLARICSQRATDQTSYCNQTILKQHASRHQTPCAKQQKQSKET